MNLNSRTTFVLTFAFLLFFPGCASIIKKSFKKPGISYESMIIEKIDPAGAEVRLFLGIDNKNNLELFLSSMTHIVYLENSRLLETTLNDRIHLKAKDKTIVEFPLQISFLNMKENLVSLWQNKKLKLNVDSHVVLDTMIGKIPFDLKYEDFIELPPLPDLDVQNIKVESMTFSEINLIVFMKILNNDQLKLDVEEMNYDIVFNNFDIAKGVMKPAQYINSENEINLSIPVNLKLLSLKRSITDILRKGEVAYDIHINIKGKSYYGEYIFPLNKTGKTRIY